MPLNDLPGQERIARLLSNSMKSGKLAHAYLFCGDDIAVLGQVGRTFAKALNCLARLDDACDDCPNCRRFDSGNFPDYLEVMPEGTRSIKIDDIRNLQEQVSLKSYEGRRKVFLIGAADMMTPEAANCLLKTLEEPPPDTIIILLTDKMSVLLPTIISRCQVVKCSLIPTDGVISYLRNNAPELLDDLELRAIAATAQGRLDMAGRLVESETRGMRRTLLESLLRLSNCRKLEIWALAELWTEAINRDNILINVLLTGIRDMLVLRETGESENKCVVNVDAVESLAEAASGLEPDIILELLSEITGLTVRRSRPRNMMLALESIMIKVWSNSHAVLC